MKIIVTGASGLLGRALMTRLSSDAGGLGEASVIGLSFTRTRAPFRRLDLRDAEAVRVFLDAERPDWIVHAAAERRPDAVDKAPEDARRLNVGATDTLATWAAAEGARILYVSTDYVFDGKNPPYDTEAQTCPLNEYGRMKLAGEESVRGSGGDWTILRIPILYGRAESLAESPITEIAAKLSAQGGGTFEDWAMRYPAHTDDVAAAMATLLAAPDSMGRGLFHFAGHEGLTKYRMARIIAPIVGVQPEAAAADSNPPAGAPRPKDCRLDGSRLEALGFSPAIRFEEGIRKVLAPFFPKGGARS